MDHKIYFAALSKVSIFANECNNKVLRIDAIKKHENITINSETPIALLYETLIYVAKIAIIINETIASSEVISEVFVLLLIALIAFPPSCISRFMLSKKLWIKSNAKINATIIVIAIIGVIKIPNATKVVKTMTIKNAIEIAAIKPKNLYLTSKNTANIAYNAPNTIKYLLVAANEVVM